MGVSCQSLSISPQKTVYAPGESVTITVVGQGEISNITVRYAPAKRNIIQSTPFISTDITGTGTYNAGTKTWAGNWTLPGDGEYIIMPNMVQANGQQCAGNPAYSSATRQGTMAGGGLTAGDTPCTGCHKTIAVDSNYGNTTGYDMKEYWNLKPGNYWMYDGVNKQCGIKNDTPPNYGTHTCVGNEGNFQTRVVAEEKVKLAGVDVFPLRFTKSKLEGYILSNKNVNFRIFLSYFQSNAPWSNATLGRPFALEYQRSASSLESLGTIIESVRHYSNESGVDFDNFYFAPQFLGKEFMPIGWKYEAIDRIYFNEGPQKIYSGNLDYKAQIRERWATDQLFFENYIDTPAYKGPGLRLRLFEAGYPIGSGWRIREDWYFAKGIGRVQIDSIDCRSRLFSNPADPDCNINSTSKMANPELTMKLTSYYSGSPLQTSISVDSSGTKWTLQASTSAGPYTGYLEDKSCISETSCTPGTPFKWGYGDGTYFWMQDGVMEVDTSKVVDFQPGLRHAWFRPWVEKPPVGATAEQVLTNTQLPWSNENIWRIEGVSLPGDFTETGDTEGDHVNIYDYNLLVSKFGNPYTIFDYNDLVTNYDK